MNLTTLAGNLPLKRQLTLQTARRGLSHAYILSGPAGSGMHTLADLISAALVCTGGGDLPCLSCTGCRKAMAHIHPDIITAGEPGKDITVAQVRALRADAYIRPNEAARKVYLLEQAHTMNQSAQNAILKLLEEGPPYAAFLLLTEHAAALLPTVISRCETLSLAPLTQEEALDALIGRYSGRPRPDLEQAARRCGGWLGRAVALLEGAEEDPAPAQAAAGLLSCLSRGSEQALLAQCVALEKWDRDQLSALLDQLALLLRDALVLAHGGSVQGPELRRQTAREAAQALPPGLLLQAAELAGSLRSAVGFYVGGGHLCGWLCAGLSALRSAPFSHGGTIWKS